MPRATVDQSSGDKIPLKTLPDGWVVLKRLSYGQKIQRREMSTQLTMEMGRGRRNNDAKAELAMLTMNSTLFDFKHCIVDHNLEDELGNKLAIDTVLGLASLDPKIGEEIEMLLDKLNNFEEELNTDEGDSLAASGRP